MKNITENLRHRVSSASLWFVTAPYLPAGLIGSALLLAYTDLMVILLGQPAAYWINSSRSSSSFAVLENLLSAGVLWYALVTLIYLALAWLFLTIFTRSFALVLWMLISSIHLTHTLFWGIGASGLADASESNQVLVIIVAIAALILGIFLAVILLNPKRPLSQSVSVKAWLKPVAVMIWALMLISAVSVSAFARRSGWALLEPEHTPGHRAISAVAYDPLREKVVLFGGVSDWLGSKFLYENDTWEWNGIDWVEMRPETIPPARAGHMLAFDEKRGVIVMFGGEDKSGSYMLSDTWEWDGADWKQVSPAIFPQGRRGGQLFYDTATKKIILSGGFYYTYPDKVFTPLNDIWEWDGTNWQFMTDTSSENVTITNPNVAYDTQQNRTILFNRDQIMDWVDGQWNEIIMDTNPPARFGTWLAADPESGNMLIFGGVNNNVQLNDTWLFDGQAWMDVNPDLMPSPRDAHVMFYDPVRKSFIVYGGMSGYALDDMWELVTP